ncbi:MAG TPA: helix-turn-helix domain-containing protein [Actinomycetota bacterium]|nr:helix-turn-helix domain-containing protein [Actinomycetota bacterium]
MGVFEAVGLSELEEQVYAAMVERPRTTLRELAKASGLPTGQLQRALLQLRDKGFVTETATRPPEYVAAPPESAVEVLVHRREEELHRARVAAAELAQRHRAAFERARTGDLLEILTGPEASAQRFRQFHAAAREEVLVIDRPPYAVHPRPSDEGASDRDLVERGVRLRAIYSREAVEMPGRLPVILAGVAAGAEARVLADVATKLVIVDRRVGLIPLNLQTLGVEDAVVVHASFLLHALVMLFESLWEKAVPLSAPSGPPGPDGDRSGDEVLRLLAAGLKDESIARALGMSRSTVARRVRELMDELGAKTRFQAGSLAQQQGRLG